MPAPLFYLASRSPRRQMLLRQLDVPFETLMLRVAAGRDRDVVEKALDDEPATHYVERIARTKAQVAWHRMQNRALPERPVLSADTEVVLDGTVFGKPHDPVDAMMMLRKLSGRSHQVFTAVALRWHQQTEVEMSVSNVTLRKLEESEIEHYIATGEPFDKAGAYAIQGRAAAFVARLDGSYSGVMGLPLCETAVLLAKIGFPVL